MQLLIDGVEYTEKHIRALIESAKELTYASLAASEEFGGDSVLPEKHIEAAIKHADVGLPPMHSFAIKTALKLHNVFHDKVAEFKKPDDTEGGSCD